MIPPAWGTLDGAVNQDLFLPVPNYLSIMRPPARNLFIVNSISSISLGVIAVIMNEFIKKTVRQIAAATPV